MSKQQIKRLAVLGVLCAALLAAATVYSVCFNDSRWVAPMDLSVYEFSPRDLPMLAAGACLLAYVLYLAAVCLRAAFAGRRKNRDARYTRSLSPWMGLCGLFGFLGFAGFWTYAEWGVIYPFIFFIFFGLFGLFFEGRLSHTMRDELFEENRRRAESAAYKTGFGLLFVVIWLVGAGMFSQNVEWCAIFMLISISLVYALVLFLSRYLLYHYEKAE